MRLVSDGGASITLHPAAYQFEVTPASGSERDWDANWLMIQGDVRTGDGRQWAFLDPCLTTWEARRLSAWLHGGARDGTAGRRDIAFHRAEPVFQPRRLPRRPHTPSGPLLPGREASRGLSAGEKRMLAKARLILLQEG